MKRNFSLLFVLALTTSASAGLITDPLGAQSPAPATNSMAPTEAKAEPLPTVDFASAKTWINDLIGSQPAGEALCLSDLMMIPDVFEALHATGHDADELRGFMDWLLLTGVVVGMDDGTGDPDDGIDSNGSDDDGSADRANGIILGGPGSDNVCSQAVLTPFNPSINGFRADTTLPTGCVFGARSYMTGAPQAPVSGIILGGPGSDNVQNRAPANEIILGGPGNDTINASINGFRADTTLPTGCVFGTTSDLQQPLMNANPAPVSVLREGYIEQENIAR